MGIDDVSNSTAAWAIILAGVTSVSLIKVASLVGNITGVTKLLTLATTELQAAMVATYAEGGISGLAGLATRLGIIGALIVGIIYDITHWEEAWEGAKILYNGVLEVLEALYNYISDTIVQGFLLYIQDIKDAFNSVLDFFQIMGVSIGAFFDGVGDGISKVFNDVVTDVEDGWNYLVNLAKDTGTAIYNFFLKPFQLLQSIADLINGTSGATGSGNVGSASGWTGGEVRAAEGGHIIGPGTGTSDSIHAMLSNGEFVVNSRAVQSVGVGFLHAVNSGALAMRSMGGMIRMATGGMIGGPQRFASGGLVAAGGGSLGGMAAVHLHIGGSTYSLLGERGVVQSLTGAARKAAITQTGRSPSWRK